MLSYFKRREKMKYVLLRMVNANNNNNKDYEMEQISSTQFVARYGRYGASKQEKIYSLSVFDKIYNQKIQKGYTDITDTVRVIEKTEEKPSDKYMRIPDEEIRSLVDELLLYANEYVKKVYTIKKQHVTESMIDNAERLVYYLWNSNSLDEFNNIMERLLTIIPQRISNVNDVLAHKPEDMKKIAAEQETHILTLRSLLDTENELSSNSGKDKLEGTILEHFGIYLRKATDTEFDVISNKLDYEHRHMLVAVYKIVQKDAQKRHEDYMEKHNMNKDNIHYYFHGTRNECVWPILKTSLKLNNNSQKQGRAFGYAHYLAPRSKKSIKYTSMRGSSQCHGNSNQFFMFLINTAYKNCYHVRAGESNIPGISNFHERDLRKLGYDAYYAHRGAHFGDYGGTAVVLNSEVMVYNDGAVLPEYLLKFDCRNSCSA